MDSKRTAERIAGRSSEDGQASSITSACFSQCTQTEALMDMRANLNNHTLEFLFPLETVCFWFSLKGVRLCVWCMALNIYPSFSITISTQQVDSKLRTCTSCALVFSHVITVNQLFVHGSSHKTRERKREREHRYASGAPH